MLKGIIGALALALAAPALADNDKAKDVDNSVKNTVDDAKDKAEKAKNDVTK